MEQRPHLRWASFVGAVMAALVAGSLLAFSVLAERTIDDAMPRGGVDARAPGSEVADPITLRDRRDRRDPEQEPSPLQALVNTPAPVPGLPGSSAVALVTTPREENDRGAGRSASDPRPRMGRVNARPGAAGPRSSSYAAARQDASDDDKRHKAPHDKDGKEHGKGPDKGHDKGDKPAKEPKAPKPQRGPEGASESPKRKATGHEKHDHDTQGAKRGKGHNKP